MQRKDMLTLHPYKIWQGKNGKWYTYLPDENGARKLKKRNTRAELEDIIIKYLENQANNPTIRDIFQDWNDRRLSLNKISASTHTRNQQIFDRHYYDFGNNKINSITVEDFIEFLENQLSEYQLSAKAFANLKGITRGIIKRAKRKKLINYTADTVMQELDISDRDFKRTVKQDSEEVFDEAETDKMLQYLMTHQDIWNLGLLLMFVTGLRVGELVALKWEDLSPEDDTIYVNRTETKFRGEDGNYRYEVKNFPKTEAGIRTVIIPQSYQWIFPSIRKMHDDEEYIFVHNGIRMKTNSIRKRLNKICEELNMPQRSPHKIRKTYCSILFENGLQSTLITNLMGHTDIKCSEKYYHRNRKGIKEAKKEISAIPEFNTKLTLIS